MRGKTQVFPLKNSTSDNCWWLRLAFESYSLSASVNSRSDSACLVFGLGFSFDFGFGFKMSHGACHWLVQSNSWCDLHYTLL